MPWRPPRPCRTTGCPETTRSGYCPKCQRAYDQQRGSAASRGYDAAWRKRRARYLLDHPLCESCRSNPSKHVDHRLAKRRGGADHESNFEALCHSCHSRKTALRDARWGPK